MKEKVKKLTKPKVWSIISASIVVVISIVLIITNFFIPVKYLASYCVIGKRAKPGVMRVTFVDVGFGDSIIVELPDGKNMLIDAGDAGYTHKSKVFKELNKRDIDTIDYLICSSVNKEHCGGLAEIVKHKNIGTVYMPYCKNKYITDEFCAFVNQIEKSRVEKIYSSYKKGVDTGEYFFTFLSPSAADLEYGEYQELNTNPSEATRANSSAMLWLEYADTAFLFTSDVQTSVLDFIVSMNELSMGYLPVDIEKCKIVQLAGHGDKLSACATFYDLLNPEVAIISVGKNGNGSPSNEAISDVVNSVGKNLYITDKHGNITIEVTADGYTVR